MYMLGPLGNKTLHIHSYMENYCSSWTLLIVIFGAFEAPFPFSSRKYGLRHFHPSTTCVFFSLRSYGRYFCVCANLGLSLLQSVKQTPVGSLSIWIWKVSLIIEFRQFWVPSSCYSNSTHDHRHFLAVRYRSIYS